MVALHLQGLFNLKAASEAVVAKDGHQRHIETMMESFARTRLFKMLEVIFDGLLSRIESMLFPTQTDIDGMEAIAMLRILHYFTELFADTVVEVHTTASIIKDKITENKAKDRYKTMTFNDEEDKKEDTKNNNNSSNSTVQSFTNSLYLFKFLEDIKSKVVSRIGSYCTEQIHWISVQKGDPKNPGVLLPFAKFPSMIAQIEHLTAGEVSSIFVITSIRLLPSLDMCVIYNYIGLGLRNS